MLILWGMMADAAPGIKVANEDFEEWIREMGQGDTQALAELYTHTKTAVYGFALSIVKNPHYAEDLMQDAYVQIFQAAGSYRPQGKPMAWILRIVRNLSLMRLRGLKDATTYDENIGTYSVEDFSQGSADRLALRAALQGLSGEERQIVMLHSVAGLKHREIAEIIQIPLSTVLSKYRRALSKLKILLGEEVD